MLVATSFHPASNDRFCLPATRNEAIRILSSAGRVARMRRCLCTLVGLVLWCPVGLVSVPAAAALPDSTGATTRVSVKNGGGQAAALGPAGAGQPAVSEKGFNVAFTSDATNLVAGDTNGVTDVFVNQGGAISRVSL